MVNTNYEIIKNIIKNKWDESAQYYDNFHGHGIKSKEEYLAWRQTLEQVLSRMGCNSVKVLDVGCGTGEMSLLLAEMGYHVTGIDLSYKMISIAKSKAAARHLEAVFELGDAESLQFEDETFDVLLNRHLLWTLPDPKQVLLEWRRVIRKGGLVVIIDALWKKDSWESKIRQLLSDLFILLLERRNPRRGWYPADINFALPHPHGMSADAVRSYLQETDYRDIELRCLNEIRDIQKKHMPLQYKLNYNIHYYLLSGFK